MIKQLPAIKEVPPSLHIRPGEDIPRDEKWKRLENFLDECHGQEGMTIPALQEAQVLWGYIPRAAMELIARELDVPMSKVYGVATFYAQFHLEPRGRHVIRICLGTACHVRGAEEVLHAMREHLGINPGGTTKDLKFTLERVACLGACGLAPTVMIDEHTYGRLTPEGVKDLLEKFD